ncbi:hypothetical protein [Streptomyces justiciae]|uniref:Uncharacterized protein n=1 Tax=Streptomyces justiciae TaxID=2780140 RepID=A0ABU3LPP3_9ACTN|nr:hypothetical protein [Streptomyces justiciae]MDT7841043.1 hypothetical protein [Streptomyces justiciae]
MTLHLPPPTLADLEHPLVGALSIFAPGITDTPPSEEEPDLDQASDPVVRPEPPAPLPPSRASRPGPYALATVRRPDRPRAA